MLVAAAICPHPPLLVPDAMGLAGRREAEPGLIIRPDPGVNAASPPGKIDAELRLLREACDEAVGALALARPGLLVIAGPGESTRPYPVTAAGTLRGLGIPFDVGTGVPVLPLSLTIGTWLAARSLPENPPWRVELQEVARSASPPDCLGLGARLAGRAPRVALLVLGDGTARRVLSVPGSADTAASRFDTAVAAALAEANAEALARIDPADAASLKAGGRAAWQVLAGAAGSPEACRAASGAGARDSRSGGERGGRPAGASHARLLYAGAPLDVGYAVASWTF